MKVQTGWRKAGVVRRAVVLGLCFVLFTIQPTLGGAAVLTHTFSAATVSVGTSPADFYRYDSGTTSAWTSAAEFDAGTYTATNASADAVVLDRIGPTGVTAPDPSIAWWDTDWTNRRCYEVDHSTTDAVSVTEYPVRVGFPLTALIADGFLQADLGDLRAVGTDGTTSLPLWPDDTADDTVWVQVDSIPSGTQSSFCLYYGHASGTTTSPSNHTEADVFIYTSAKDVYYAVSEAFSPPGATINVVSYIDGNTVTRTDGTAVTLAAAGDLATFDAAGTEPGSAFSVLGPISAAGIGDGLVPVAYAGTSFAVPLSRDSQRFSFVAPFADAAVDLYEGNTLVSSFVVSTGTPYTHSTNDIGAGSIALIESDVPVLVTHRSDIGGDAVPLYPARTGTFYAVRSSELLIGYTADTTTVILAASDGTVGSISGDRGDLSVVSGGTAQGGGAGDGFMLSSDQPISVLAAADGDGTESVTVLPATESNSSYWIPSDSQYLAFSCPTEASTDVPVTVSAPASPVRPVVCTGGPDIAWAVDTADLAVTTTGISVASDTGSPFHVYYEDLATDDQNGVLGMKQGRQYTWPEPAIIPGGDEGIFESAGSWESQTIDTGPGSGIYGLVSLVGTTPASTALRMQIATSTAGTPSSFVGPDGTGSTYFELSSLPAAVPFSQDGNRLLRVRAELTTTDPASETPRLDLVSVDAHLSSLDRSLGTNPTIGLTTTADPAITTSYLLRVKTTNAAIAGSEATAVYRGASNLANLATETVRFVNDELGTDSVQQSNTLPADPPVTFQQDRPHSVVLDHSAVGSGTTTVAFAWQLDYAGAGSLFLETDFAVEVTAP